MNEVIGRLPGRGTVDSRYIRSRASGAGREQRPKKRCTQCNTMPSTYKIMTVGWNRTFLFCPKRRQATTTAAETSRALVLAFTHRLLRRVEAPRTRRPAGDSSGLRKSACDGHCIYQLFTPEAPPRHPDRETGPVRRSKGPEPPWIDRSIDRSIFRVLNRASGMTPIITPSIEHHSIAHTSASIHIHDTYVPRHHPHPPRPNRHHAIRADSAAAAAAAGGRAAGGHGRCGVG